MSSGQPDFDLRHRSVMITGANRGLGAALCKTILQYSPKIIHAGFRSAPGELKDPRIQWCQLDIQAPESVAEIAARVGDIDILVNNAGVLLPAATDPKQELINLRTMMDVHLYAPLCLIDALLPSMQRSQHPTIVNIISMSAFVNVAGCEAYCTSKAALHAATQGLRLKYPNIRCVGVYPGPTATDMTAGSPVALADPAESATAIVAGIMAGETSIFPDPAARDVESVIGTSVATLEARFARLLAE
tara:strand:- start:556 stop:1293 length:738 start_codon:yes stop_codon:yes gene_type:complete